MIKVATVFSGIGSFEYALKKMNVEHEIVFACDCGDRNANIPKDVQNDILRIEDNKKREKIVNEIYNKSKKLNKVKDTYFQNYKIDEDRWFTDIRFVNGNPYKNKIDIFVGGSPCQSFSIMGKRGGLEDTRGTLFYEYARLIDEIRPKAFIYENVPGMIVHDKGRTWETIKNVFASLGYSYYYQILDASNYGIPQARKRLFVVGFRNDNPVNFTFPAPIKLKHTAEYYLDKNIDQKYYFKRKGFEFITNPKYYGRAKINSEIIRTEKRNQQFNWNGDFRFEPLTMINNKSILDNAYIGIYNGVAGVARKLTPRECHRLMGFQDDFIINQNDVDAYKQSGNSIVVNVIEEIVKQILAATRL